MTGYLERIVGRALGIVPVVRLRRDPVFVDLPAGDADAWNDAAGATGEPQRAAQGREPSRGPAASRSERALPRDAATTASRPVDATAKPLPAGPPAQPARHVPLDGDFESGETTAPPAADARAAAARAAEVRAEMSAPPSERDGPRRARSDTVSGETAPADARPSGAPRVDAAEADDAIVRRREASGPYVPVVEAAAADAASLAQTRVPVETARVAASKRSGELTPARIADGDLAPTAIETPAAPWRAPTARAAIAHSDGVFEQRVTERAVAGRREAVVAATRRSATPDAGDPLTISVAIGRIEIQRPPPPAPPRAAAKQSTLDDYLRRRAEIKRR